MRRTRLRLNLLPALSPLFVPSPVCVRLSAYLETPMNTATTPYGPLIVKNYAYRIGEKEDAPGVNLGPLPEKIFKWVNDGADPHKVSAADRQWCCGLYCLCCHDAGLPNGPKTMSSGALFDYCKAHGEIVCIPKRWTHNGHVYAAQGHMQGARPGDAGLVMDSTKSTGVRHTVCLKKQVRPGVWETIEGNEENQVEEGERDLSTLIICRPFKVA